jgi:formiminoglutamase
VSNLKNYSIFNELDQTHPVVVSIPHSGTYISSEMRKQLMPNVILPNMDWFLRELYDFLPLDHVTVLENNTSRYVADPNRDNEADPTGNYHTLVYQKTTLNRPMYHHPLTREEVDQRIERYYKPYHQALKQLLENKLTAYKKVFLLDLHSFAEFGNPPVLQDFVLGNRNGLTTSRETAQVMTKLMSDAGYTVSDNYPFPGGYITKHYGTNYGNRIESMQIEIRYREYIGDRYYGEEELTHWDKPTFEHAKENLKVIFQHFLSFIHNNGI